MLFVKAMYKFLKKYSHFIVEHRLLFFLILMLITTIFYAGTKYVYTVSSFEKVLPNDVSSVKGAKLLRDNVLGQDGIVVMLKVNDNSNLFNQPSTVLNTQVFNYLDHLTQELKKDSNTVLIFSPSDLIKAYNRGKIPITNEELEELLNKNRELKRYLNMYISPDKKMIIMIITTDLTNDDEALARYFNKVKKIISDLGQPSGFKIELTGSPSIQQRLSELIQRDQKVTQWVSTVLVFLVTALTFRSILAAIIPILIVTVANIWLSGFMGYFDIPLSTLAAGVAALVIGIGIDYAIHFMTRFKLERRRFRAIKEAVEESLSNTGSSLAITAAATIGAFLAFNIGEMPEMGKFGNLMALGILFSLILSLSLLPILLIWEERIIYWVLSKMRIGIEHEFKIVLTKEAIDIKSELPYCPIEKRKELNLRLKEIENELKNFELTLEDVKYLEGLIDDKKENEETNNNLKNNLKSNEKSNKK